METLDPSTLPDVTPTFTFDRRSETVISPGGLVSVAGITVMTGGTELSCGSCMLAFGFWGTLVGISCVAVGLWDEMSKSQGGTSHLLLLGFVILGLSFMVVGGVVAFYVVTKKKRKMTRDDREEGREVLVESGRIIKRVTV